MLPYECGPMTNASTPKTSAKVGKRLLLMFSALTVSAVGAEFLYRTLKPRPFTPPEIWTSTGGAVPTSEIANFLRTSDEGAADRPHPRGTLRPGLSFRQFYDRPTLDYFDEDGCVSAVINDLGFRDLPFDVEKKPGELRILTVGDSFTFGSGVQTEDTWSQVLESMLREEHDGPVEVINGGFAAGSHTTAGYVDWIRTDGVAFHPDVLIIGFCLNDLGNVPMLTYSTQLQGKPWLGGISEVLNAIQLAWQRRKAREFAYPPELLAQATLVFQAQNKDSIARSLNALTAIKEIADEHGVRLLVAVVPMVTQLRHYPLEGLHRLITEHCDRHGIEWVDLLAKFAGQEASELWVHPTDQHPNDVGHRLIAEGIRDYLQAHPQRR